MQASRWPQPACRFTVDIQDLDVAPHVFKSICRTHSWMRHVFADGGDGRPKLRGKLEKIGCWTMEMAKRSARAKGFEVITRRWVVRKALKILR